MKEINKLCKRTKQIKHFLLIYNIVFFFLLWFCFVAREQAYLNTQTHTHTHTHRHPYTTKPNKPTRGQNGVYQTPADAKQLLSRGELKTMPITPGYFSCFKSFKMFRI